MLRRSRRALAGAALLPLLLAGAARAAAAQSPAADTAAPARGALSAAARRLAAADSVPRLGRGVLPPWLAVNGYFTQAAGRSEGGMMSGVPAGGTADFRRAAVLARVQPTLTDRLVVQVAHRRMGRSPAAQFQPDVRLDWLFYERDLGDATRLRAGRIPLPAGIYNETRYVGTLLPFYQAPTSVYREKEFSNEALDGGLVSHEFSGGAGFSVETALYGGYFRYVESSPVPFPPTLPPGMDPAAAQALARAAAQAGAPAGALPPGATPGGWTYASARATARDVVGGTVWVNTPLPGLRVGGGAVRSRVKGGLRPNGGVARATIGHASVDGSFDRVFVRAEALAADLETARVRGGYVQAGGRVAGPLSLNVQTDYSHMHVNFLPLPPTYQARPLGFVQHRDHAASAVWAVRPTLQARVEGHVTRGYNAEEGLDLTGPARRGRYVVLSLSAAF